MNKYVNQGERLRTFLASESMSQRDFAEKVGCKQSIISRIVSGTVRPGIDLACQIQLATGDKLGPADWAAGQKEGASQ